MIENGDSFDAPPGSFVKIGTGTLTLSGPNTYSGGTTVDGGTLLVTTHGASGTGSGPVQINAGTLGGTGVIDGPVRIGSQGHDQAFLCPGVNGIGTLTLNGRLTFRPRGVYQCDLDLTRVRSDQVAAAQVFIRGGAWFSLTAHGWRTLPVGSVLTVINNTGTESIRGVFSNLADGAIVSVKGNNLQVSYEGGDGNDLTLTVVP